MPLLKLFIIYQKHYGLLGKMSLTNKQKKALAECAQMFRNKSFYAVARGHQIGIFNTWTECETQVKGFQKARFKKFKTRTEAENFIKEFGGAAAASFVQKSLEDPVTLPSVDSNRQRDFWPESDGDTFEQDAIANVDLLNALYEVEGLPEKPSSSNLLKRKAAGEYDSNSKIPKYASTVLKVTGYIHKGKFKFPIDDEGYVIIYTDGSCINNGQKNASAGFGVYFGKDHPLNAAQPVVGRVTNNVGEIQAAAHAIQIARDLGISRVCICTDSQFLINAVTCWMSAWKRKDWRLKSGEPVKNVVDFKMLDFLLQDGQIIVKWNYVKGHANIEGNDMADKLARDGAAEYARMNLNK